MTYFVNEYQYTADVSAESVIAWRRKKFRVGYLYIPIAALIILLASVGFGHFRPDVLIMEVVPLLVLVMYIRAEKIGAKSERERIEVLYKYAVPVFHVEIGEDLHVITPRSESHVSFSDVENMVETKNLIVLMIKGRMTISLHKNGFLQGNAEECKRYLKERIDRYGN